MNHDTEPDDPIALPQAPAELTAEEIEAYDNPGSRAPVVLAVDSSESMTSEMADLNAAIAAFVAELRSDLRCRQSVELCVVSFGGAAAILEVPFRSLMDLENHHVPELVASGNTPLGSALNLALDQIRDRRRMYKSTGLAGYRPWIVLLSDGAPNDEYASAIARLRRKTDAGEVLLFPIGVGAHADMEFLQHIAQPGRPAKRLKDVTCYRELFSWLVDSLRVVSGSTTNQRPLLPPTDRWST